MVNIFPFKISAVEQLKVELRYIMFNRDWEEQYVLSAPGYVADIYFAVTQSPFSGFSLLIATSFKVIKSVVPYKNIEMEEYLLKL
jgi:hypothetical protein